MSERSYLAAIRESYDTVAEEYTRRYPPSRLDPLGRAMLGVFAEVVCGPVADLGCGPGGVTALLADLGVSVSGVDISPEMIVRTCKALPHVPFRVGTMTALDVDDGGLGGDPRALLDPSHATTRLDAVAARDPPGPQIKALLRNLWHGG